MERLTTRNGKGKAVCNTGCPNKVNFHCCAGCVVFQDQLNKLAIYEDAEEQGRLIMLDFKVGDTAYTVDVPDCKSGDCPDVDEDICKFSRISSPTEEVRQCQMGHMQIHKIEIDEAVIELGADGNVEIIVNGYIDSSNIFKTRIESEVALAERRKAHDEQM
jgi:hypothetical protein